MALFEVAFVLSLLFQSIYRSEAGDGPKIVIAPSPITLHQGQTAVFNCTTEQAAVLKWRSPRPANVEIQSSEKFHVSNNSLEIRNVQQQDKGLYTCIASNSFGSSSAQADLTVLDPPVAINFTTKPINQTGTEGSSVTFYCKASGYPIPTVVWSKRVGQLPEGRHSFPSAGTLKLTNLLSSDFGLYVCTAKNILESISTSVYLHIKGLPRIIKGPASVTVNELASVILTCVTEGVPKADVLWTTPSGRSLNYTNQLHPDGRITVLSNHSLLITNVSAWDMGTYTCIAMNEVGRQASLPAKVNVRSKPRFSVQLQNLSKVAGEQVIVDCEVIAFPEVDYKWSYYNGTIVTHNRQLKLTSLKAVNEGYYTCSVNNSFGSSEASFFLRVKVPPTFVVQPKDQIVKKGHKASLTCKVRGDPVPVITWYSQDVIIRNSSRYTVSRDGVLFIDSVIDDDSGHYKCVAKNEVGQKSASTNLLVVDIPKLTATPSNRTVNENTQFTWPCRALGADTPKMKWFRNNGQTLENITNRATVTDEGDLKFNAVTRIDRGLYICSACNSAGCTNVQAFLNIQYPPSFPVSPPAVGVKEGQDAELECKPDSSPTAVIIWQSPSGAVIPGNSYRIVIYRVGPQDTGDYSCSAENKLGSASSHVKLYIGTKVSILDFAKRDVSNGNIQLQCKVAGEPYPLITWYVGLTAMPSYKFPEYKVTPQKEFQVAENTVNAGNVSCNATNAHSTVMKRANVPSVPEAFMVTNIESSSVLVTWSQAVAIELIIHYTVEYRLANHILWQGVNVSGTLTKYKIGNLAPYSLYVLRLAALNGLGKSDFTSPRNVTTQMAAPSRPRNLTIQALNAHVISVSWVTPLNLNGPDSNLSYSIDVKVGQNVTSCVIGHVPGSVHNEYNVTNLAPYTTYKITVTGRRQFSKGKLLQGLGTHLTGSTLQLVPDTPPLDLVVASNGPNQILVKWKIPSYSIQGYHISYKQFTSMESYRLTALLGMSENSHLITGLKEDTQYTVKARMFSNAGIGPFSNPSVVRTDLGVSAAKGTFVGSGEKLGLRVAIAGIVFGLLFLVLVLIIVVVRLHRSTRTRKSFNVSFKSRGIKYVIGKSRRSADRSESDVSHTGQYNIGECVEEDIDMQLFEPGTQSPDAACRRPAHSAIQPDDHQDNSQTYDVLVEEQMGMRLTSADLSNMKIDSQRLVWVSTEDDYEDLNIDREGQHDSDDVFDKKNHDRRLSEISNEPPILNQLLTEIERGADQKYTFSEKAKHSAKNKGRHKQKSSEMGLNNGGYSDFSSEELKNSPTEETKKQLDSKLLEENAVYSFVDLDEKRKSRAALRDSEPQTLRVDPVEEKPPDLPPPPREAFDKDIQKHELDSDGLSNDKSGTSLTGHLPDIVSHQGVDPVGKIEPIVSRMNEQVRPDPKKRRVASWADDDAPVGDTGLGRNFFVDM